jgi:putative transposase
MPRTARIAPGGVIHHVLNRGVRKMTLFRGRSDYLAFQQCLLDTMRIVPVPVLGYCVMPNHWHLVLLPEHDGDLARFMLRLTITHVRRWSEHRRTVGEGHVYQGRYKSFPCQSDEHAWTVLRYVERNPLRAKLVERAQEWPWSSLGQELLEEKVRLPLASSPPGARRADWIDWVNLPQTPAEESAIVSCIEKSRPFGSDRWLQRAMRTLGWREQKMRGRPKKRGK